MGPSEFLHLVWPTNGVFCIATPRPVKGFNHRTFDHIDEAAQYCESITDSQDVYFATHALKQYKVWNEEKNKWQIRVQSNMRASRVFFLDLDVDANDPAKYSDQKEAITALKNIVVAMRLPQPTLTSSGGGVHVYWVIDEEMDSATVWLTEARKLRALMDHAGLLFDPTRTTDRSSVLRVPGTYNHKGGGKRPVQMLKQSPSVPFAQWRATIDAALVTASLDVPDVGDEFGSNTKLGFDGPPPRLPAVLQVCPQIRRLVEDPASCSEPEWYNGIVGILVHTENGIENVHKASQGYESYSTEETDAKIAQWGDKFPSRCKTIEGVVNRQHKDLCRTCKHWPAQSSPIPIARRHDDADPPALEFRRDDGTTEVVELPKPPNPYRRLPTGAIILVTENDDGTEKTTPIYEYDLYPLRRSNNVVRHTEMQTWRAHLSHGHTEEFAIEASSFVDDKALRCKLANHGIYPKNFPYLREYMSAYIRELQAKQPLTTQIDQFGWNRERTQFVIGNRCVMRDGSVVPVTLSGIASSVAQRSLDKAGTLERQVELLRFFDDKRYVDRQFMVVSGLGAALFAATGHHGVILSACGESGTSKSTSLLAAASMWGMPVRYVMGGTHDGATPLFRAQTRDVLCNLPVCVDEITLMDEASAKEMVMSATQANARGRLNQDGSFKVQADHERSTVTLMTSNRSLYSMLQERNRAGTAASVRLVEMVYQRVAFDPAIKAENFLRELCKNYGHIGEEVMRSAVQDFDLIERSVQRIKEDLAMKAGMAPEERFWFSLFGADLLSLRVARNKGLLFYDWNYMRDWILRERIPVARSNISDERAMYNPVVVLGNFLEAIHGDTLILDYPGGGQIANTIQVPHREMRAHHDVSQGKIWALRDVWKQWCDKHGHQQHSLMRELQSMKIVTCANRAVILGKGTVYAKTRSTCMEVDLTHPLLRLSDDTKKLKEPKSREDDDE